MLARTVLLAVILFLKLALFAQVKIGDNATTINAASLLELESSNKGFTLPRISLSNINSASPLSTTALNATLVFNTNASLASGTGKGVYYWDSLNTQWIPVNLIQLPGVPNYLPKWTTSTTIGASSILYDNGSGLGIKTSTPLNGIDISGSAAIGSYAGINTAPANGLIISGQVGLGTPSPASGTKLDVNGSFKLGIGGSTLNNLIKTTGTLNSSVSFPVLNLGTVSGTISISSATVGATVIINPRGSLPNGVTIAYAYVSAAGTLTVYFSSVIINASSIPTSFVFDITLIQ